VAAEPILENGVALDAAAALIFEPFGVAAIGCTETARGPAPIAAGEGRDVGA
jgi:hypothetical protein